MEDPERDQRGSGWKRAAREITACIAARPTEYDTACKAVMADLTTMLKATGRPPPTVASGYWPTFLVSWEGAGVDDLWLEVFGDRIEVYHRTETLFDVWDELHAPGETFTDEFMAAMPLPSQGAGGG